MSRWVPILLLACACSRTAEVPIFLWHAVGEASGDPHELTAAELDEQLTLIESFGATPVTLAQLFDFREKGTPLPKRAVMIARRRSPSTRVDLPALFRPTATVRSRSGIS